MRTAKDMFHHIYKTTEMGIQGIETVQPITDSLPLQRALQQQKSEYEELNRQAAAYMQKRGIAIRPINPLVRYSSHVMARTQLMQDRSPSKIAELMIRGNTTGMVKSIRNLHEYNLSDTDAAELTDKLLQTERNNIEQMKPFL